MQIVVELWPTQRHLLETLRNIERNLLEFFSKNPFISLDMQIFGHLSLNFDLLNAICRPNIELSAAPSVGFFRETLFFDWNLFE